MKVFPQGNANLPRLVGSLKGYDIHRFIADAIAGLTVGLVALPLAMAFAISSGVPPQAGLYTAVVAGFLISALGGSRCQIGGPTGAFVVVIYGIVAKYGMDGLALCTVMAGAMLVVMGLTGLGSAIKYIPRPVVIGFTNGIAVLIASTQIKDFFGLYIPKVPGDFAGRMDAIFRAYATASPVSSALGLAAIGVIVVLLKVNRRIPGSIVALFVGTAIAWRFHLPIDTLETRFGGIPSGLPHWVTPHFRPELIATLLSPALTVTMLGAVESLLSATVADRMSGDKHNSNVELVAQGIANLFSPLFGGLPATGAIARTATNIRSGAQTPVAGMIHAVTLLVILLVAAPLAKHIPLCLLAAILLVVSYNMGEWREIPDIVKQSKADASVWLITFALTVFADLTVAVEAGMILAALLYITKVTSTTTVSEITEDYVQEGVAHSLQAHTLPAGVAAFRIHGPFLFGATDKLSIIQERLDTLPSVVLLRLRNMTAIDATGLHALEDLVDKFRESGRTLVMCGVREQPERFMRRSDFSSRAGRENLVPSLEAGIARAREILGDEIDVE